MKHDKAMLKKLCENCYFGDGDYRDAMKAYAEHLIHDFLDEREGLKKYIAELEAHINEREGSVFGTK